MKKNIKHFFLLTAIAVGAIHMVNRFIDMTAEMKNILKSQNGNYYDWKNGKIYFSKRGSGSPVLLIHELDPTSSSYEWCRLIKKLEKNHTVYAIDLLGCGRSDKPYLTYTSYLYVQLIIDFIHNVIQKKPDIITTGRSVSFAILAQHMEKDLIKRIIAINPPAPSEFEHIADKFSAIRKVLIELPIIGTFIYNIKTHEKNIEKELRDVYFYKPQLVSSKMLDAYYESAHMGSSHGRYLLASMEGHYTDNSIVHALKAMEIPLYIIQSRTIQNAVHTADFYAKNNNQAEITYLSNSGLTPQLEIPDKLLSVIDMFLDDQRD